MANNDGVDSIRFSSRNQAAYDVAERRLDAPMMILAIVLGIVLIIQYFGNPTTGQDSALNIVATVIWVVFILEYALLAWLAPDRKQMIRTHKLDLFLIVVPFLRPLRVLRLLRAFAGFSAAFVMGRRIMARRGLQWIIVAVVGIIISGAALTMVAERQNPDSAIDSFGTALWWAIVTCTTVGYGDVSPITTTGRVIAVVLMIVGIALLSVITANVASLFVEQDVQDEHEDLKAELAQLNEKLDLLLSQANSRRIVDHG